MIEKQWIYVETDENAVIELQKVLKIHPIFCQLLVQRGIKTYDEAKLFFRPKLTYLHDPFLMKGMEQAVLRLEKSNSKSRKNSPLWRLRCGRHNFRCIDVFVSKKSSQTFRILYSAPLQRRLWNFVSRN